MSSYRNDNGKEKKRDFDYIEAEIVEDESSKTKTSPLSKIAGIFESAKDKLSNLFFNSIKESPVSISKKKHKKEMDIVQDNIDQLFKNTGLVGGMFGSIAKSIARPMVSSLLDSMERSRNDIEDVTILAKRALQNDPKFIGILGSSDLELSSPIQSSLSSSSVNGIGQTNIFLVIPFEGLYNNGVVEIISTIPNEKSSSIRRIVLDSLKVRLSNGNTMIINTSGSYGSTNIIDV